MWLFDVWPKICVSIATTEMDFQHIYDIDIIESYLYSFILQQIFRIMSNQLDHWILYIEDCC